MVVGASHSRPCVAALAFISHRLLRPSRDTSSRRMTCKMLQRPISSFCAYCAAAPLTLPTNRLTIWISCRYLAFFSAAISTSRTVCACLRRPLSLIEHQASYSCLSHPTGISTSTNVHDTPRRPWEPVLFKLASRIGGPHVDQSYLSTVGVSLFAKEKVRCLRLPPTTTTTTKNALSRGTRPRR